MAPVEPIFLSTWRTAASAGAVLTRTRTLSYRQWVFSITSANAITLSVPTSGAWRLQSAITAARTYVESNQAVAVPGTMGEARSQLYEVQRPRTEFGQRRLHCLARIVQLYPTRRVQEYSVEANTTAPLAVPDMNSCTLTA